MTREDGWFDFMVNGGGAATLQFGKSPFPPKIETLFAPWNEVRHRHREYGDGGRVKNVPVQSAKKCIKHDTCWAARPGPGRYHK